MQCTGIGEHSVLTSTITRACQVMLTVDGQLVLGSQGKERPGYPGRS